jgi:hypothetical protein
MPNIRWHFGISAYSYHPASELIFQTCVDPFYGGAFVITNPWNTVALVRKHRLHMLNGDVDGVDL